MTSCCTVGLRSVIQRTFHLLRENCIGRKLQSEATAASVCFLFAFVALLLGGSQFAGAQTQPIQCGQSSDSDIFIMLDVTGSVSEAELEDEKAAAKALIDFFTGGNPLPHVAIGSFNSDCGSRSECNNSTFDHARIVVPLSDNYAAHQLALAPTPNGLIGPGPGGAGLGLTNIEKAIQLGQDHLAAFGSPSRRDFVIFISDGDPNVPGIFTVPTECNACNCPIAEDLGATAAANALAAGITIFTIHAGDSSCGGPEYLESRIASSPTNHFTSAGNLSDIFRQIAEAISCDDGLDCTADSCNTNTKFCEFVELDEDKDGLGDCSDLCFGDNSMIGLPCDGPDNDTCPTGVYDCPTNGVLTCTDGPEFDDRDGDGTSDCEDGCPDDKGKIDPLVCGCGIPDTDTDSDGTPDCKDRCVDDPFKIAPGICGCGTPDEKS
ncbi:MAG: VWA domain-containing protein, partial [Bdellovibrionales bacterium]|nr:VWA domain-containing protein [Bdellovibrionales bacterium]